MLCRKKITAEYFPDSVKTVAAREAYVKDLNDDIPGLNVKLEDFEYNPAKRTLAKLISVSILGKLSQRCIKKQTKIVTNAQEISIIRYDPNYVLLNIHPMTDFLYQCEYELKASSCSYSRMTHCTYYSCILAQSRLKMVKDLRLVMSLKAKIMYMDTDSIVLITHKAIKPLIAQLLKLGSKKFGNYKSEVGDETIIMFLSLGAKSYAYITLRGNQVVKIKGFSTNQQGVEEILSYSRLKEMLINFILGHEDDQEVPTRSFKIDKHEMTITYKESSKTFRNYNASLTSKRAVIINSFTGTIDTRPFGATTRTFVDQAPNNDLLNSIKTHDIEK